LARRFRLNVTYSMTVVAEPTQYMNLLQLLQIKGDYENIAKAIYELIKRGEREIAYTLALEVSEINGFNKKVLDAIPVEPELEA